jgi:lysophospholipid acyltransferase (LPLAT)-like uncharacterized protein
MKIRNPIAHWLIARLATWILKVLFLTVRVDHRCLKAFATPYHRKDGGQRYCFCLWHDAIVTALFSLKTADMAALISRHQDGSYLTHAIKLLGITPVRGSASRGGAQATKQLIDRPDLHVCITPDGPRGPRRTMKEGIIFLASRTQRPVVPTTVVATRGWSVPGGWSDMLLPKPFSKVLLLAGLPVDVPQDLGREQMADVAARVQDEMDRLDAIGQRIIAGDESAWEELQANPSVATQNLSETRAA